VQDHLINVGMGWEGMGFWPPVNWLGLDGMTGEVRSHTYIMIEGSVRAPEVVPSFCLDRTQGSEALALSPLPPTLLGGKAQNLRPFQSVPAMANSSRFSSSTKIRALRSSFPISLPPTMRGGPAQNTESHQDSVQAHSRFEWDDAVHSSPHFGARLYCQHERFAFVLDKARACQL
jgi:hypothetical protein